MRRHLAAFLVLFPALPAAPPTALDRYIAKPDKAYAWTHAGSLPCGTGCTADLLDLKSQTWRSESEVDRTVWQHWLTVIRPEKVSTPIAFLFINGGANNGRPPARAEALLAGVARETGAVVADLRMVPNQPLQFSGANRPLVEDGLIAYTWDKYLRGGDEEWPARLPMTKAAVRAMDTITAFCKTAEGGALTVDKFFVAGASKRGWTTWTTAAVDQRVVAIAPMVIDLLNVVPSFVHHWRVYGFWAPAIKDYVDSKVIDWMLTPENKKLMEIEEPFEYRDRLTMPKYMVNATGDQFFVPDSAQFYWKDLKGEKYLRYVPNADHSMRNTDAVPSIVAFVQTVIQNKPRPRFDWTLEGDGSIRVTTQDPPSEVKLWQASNEKARDFRLMTIGPAWKSAPLEGNRGGFVGKVETPASGWTAFFVELTYPGPGAYPLKFTTQVRVTPDRYPFPAPDLKKPQ